MPTNLGIRAAVIALVLAATGLALAAPASAAPPVAVDDHRYMYPGQGRVFDVLANDSDPDGDELAICRVGDFDEERYYVDIEDGKLFVFAFEEASEDLVITYYACDFETLVPATLTVSFRTIEPIRIVKLDRPGRLRVINDNNRFVRFLYGSFREEKPDGRARVPAGESVVISVHRQKIDWVAYFGNGVLVGFGHVRGIELPGRSQPVDRTRITLSRAEAKLWAAQR